MFAMLYQVRLNLNKERLKLKSILVPSNVCFLYNFLSNKIQQNLLNAQIKCSNNTYNSQTEQPTKHSANNPSFPPLLSKNYLPLRWQLQFFIILPTEEIIIEKVSIQCCLKHSTRPHNPLSIPGLSKITIDPVDNI